MALVNALTSESSGPRSAAPPSNGADEGARQPSDPPASRRTSRQRTPVVPLVIRVTGAPTRVFVTVAGGGGQVLQQGTLSTGDTRQYNQAPLNVVVADAGSVRVTIYGKVQPPGQPGQRGEWVVPKR